MSIFPKRTIRKSKVILHTSYHYKDNPKPLLVKCEMVDPLKKITSIFEKTFIHFPKNPNNYISTENGYSKGSSTFIYAKYLENKLISSENLNKILQRLPLATNDYHLIDIEPNFHLGKYLIKSSTTIQGVTLESSTLDSDYFVVEELDVTREGNDAFVINNSPEDTPFRICYFQNGSYKEYHSEVKGSSKSKVPSSFNLDNAYLLYAEDKGIVPFSNEKIIFRNPKVQYITDKHKTLVKIDENNCFEIENEVHELWSFLENIQNRKKVIELFGRKNYQILLSHNMICEKKCDKFN